MRTVLVATIVALVGWSAPVAAQETTGRVSGQILDEAGNPVAYANLVIAGPSLQGSRGVVARQDGRFAVLELPAGTYTVQVSHISYQAKTIERVLVQLGRTTDLGEISLPDRAHEMETVVVTALRPLIEPSTALLGANLVDSDFENLPLERDYREVATLLPHAQESYLGDGVNFAGASGLDNRYFIDGVDVTDPFRGVTGTSLPYNFVREVQIRTGGYEAEYRSSLGGTINAVTYSGGNETSARIFGFYVSDRFTAVRRAPSGEPRTGDYAFYDLGAGIGGPLARDRLWFYFGYNPTVLREDVEIPGQGVHQDETVAHRFAGKLTWQANGGNNVVLTIFGDPTFRSAVGGGILGAPGDSLTSPDPWLTDKAQGGVNASLRGTHMLSERLLLTSAVSLVTRLEKNIPASGDRMEPVVTDFETGVVSGGAGGYDDHTSYVGTVGVDATLLAGRHQLKGGLSYRENRLEGSDGWAVVDRYSEDSWFEGRGEYDGTLRNRVPSAFLQDSWTPAGWLALNVGLRWDGLYILGSDGGIAQRFDDQWQPRAGFVIRPGQTGNQRLYGSYGRFYHELATNALTLYYADADAAGGYWATCDHDPREGLDDCEVTRFGGTIQDEIDLTGQHYDEFTLGYERALGGSSRVGIRGVYRNLCECLEDGINPVTGESWFGNPGSGELSDFPEAKREYRALELSFVRWPASGTQVVASYVLSRSEGNYPGLYHSDGQYSYPNINGYFDLVEWMVDSSGLLPNDRTHVLKLAASRRFRWGFSAGTSFSWATGTPLNEWAPYSAAWVFLRPRGTNGRTPEIWSWNVRLGYELPGRGSVRPRLTVDFLNIASRREPVTMDQMHYLDPEQTLVNPHYLDATAYQPPTAVRLGLEMRL